MRTTVIGQALRFISGNRLLKYPDEVEVPARYRQSSRSKEKTSPSAAQEQDQHRIERKPSPPIELAPPIDAADPASTSASGGAAIADIPRRRPSDAASDSTRVDSGTPDRAEKGGKDKNLVEFEENDPENPQNWSTAYKCFVTFLIALLTFSVYIGSSIYTSGLTGPNSVMEVFNVSQTSALVGLTVFVAGYGLGPLLWSPMSEIPAIGRNPVYIGTLAVFVALQFPTAYAKNIHTLLAMRFLAGFFGSPALATGGASLADMFPPKKLAYALGVWGCGAVSGPVLGPLLGGFVFQANGWQWTIWVLLWLSGGCLVLLVFALPETSSANILYRRAARLRKATGNQDLKSQGEIDGQDMTASKIVNMSLLKPFVLLAEPIVFCLNLYISLIYALLYVWFESFPLVFVENHNFSPGANGLAFLGILVGSLIGMGGFIVYGYTWLEPQFEKAENGLIKPEQRLPPLYVGAFCIPISLFMFSWTGAYPSVHWIAPIIGSAFFGVGSFCLFQSIFGYLTDAYPQDAASVLAGNDVMRSCTASAFPLFAGAMYSRLGIGGAGSLLGGLAVLFIPIPFILSRYGSKIRHRSKRAVHDEDAD